ncbi:hypothetical protein Ahy_B04g072377 isoform B [Arachis hypogaea]|uniref:Uncharacterized protein n=1 Tax=Arachis hypogaea TaxID=3818 RepID=A0A444ZMW8_ARAHY|nr:hypothetical protein Ahy_B04g072377 isoform B [Arachis hypogaea]
MKHEPLFLSVARATSSLRGCYFCFFRRCRCRRCRCHRCVAQSLSLSSLASHEIPLLPLSSHLLPSSQSSLCRCSHRICSLWLLFYLISTRSLSSSRNHLKFQVFSEERWKGW